ncbi:DUF3015 family protein [Vibrio penaeicida]|uniref:DUF3015 domain-containing protein n=1 Tax=Vibrio penaeicida TaxID=104609 RepID=A0AAV5NRY0_9VIBR|nr:DUF3015 family protein [Vibrio penaeicida]RTZ22308.1 DUF3015 domain-containing protein [Vibrio penaeicida]GLQ73299.1 hypothetical protein GCM10007932_26590 [Vibrio penaeicida]
MKKITVTALTIASLFTGNAMAEDSINPWTHCGIGAMIFNDNGTAAAISNIIWDLGTTAVSSKISSQESCEGKRVEAAMFIQDNYDHIMEETSQGEGEHLNAMLDILEVEKNAQASVISKVRAEMATQLDAAPQAYYNTVVANI